MLYDVPIDRQWFKAICRGEKTIEGKKGSPTWSSVEVGDELKFVSGSEYCIKTVLDIRWYSSVENYLVCEGLRHTLPGVSSLQEGLNIYLKPMGYWEPEEVSEYGVLAFVLE